MMIMMSVSRVIENNTLQTILLLHIRQKLINIEKRVSRLIILVSSIFSV